MILTSLWKRLVSASSKTPSIFLITTLAGWLLSGSRKSVRKTSPKEPQPTCHFTYRLLHSNFGICLIFCATQFFRTISQGNLNGFDILPTRTRQTNKQTKNSYNPAVTLNVQQDFLNYNYPTITMTRHVLVSTCLVKGSDSQSSLVWIQLLCSLIETRRSIIYK